MNYNSGKMVLQLSLVAAGIVSATGCSTTSSNNRNQTQFAGQYQQRAYLTKVSSVDYIKSEFSDFVQCVKQNVKQHPPPLEIGISNLSDRSTAVGYPGFLPKDFVPDVASHLHELGLTVVATQQNGGSKHLLEGGVSTFDFSVNGVSNQNSVGIGHPSVPLSYSKQDSSEIKYGRGSVVVNAWSFVETNVKSKICDKKHKNKSCAIIKGLTPAIKQMVTGTGRVEFTFKRQEGEKSSAVGVVILTFGSKNIKFDIEGPQASAQAAMWLASTLAVNETFRFRCSMSSPTKKVQGA